MRMNGVAPPLLCGVALCSVKPEGALVALVDEIRPALRGSVANRVAISRLAPMAVQIYVRAFAKGTWPKMPIDQCKQQLEHAAQFASTDLQSEVKKRLAPLDAGQRAAITAWASDELKRLTQPGEAVSKVVYLHELEKLTRRIAMLQTVLGQSEDKAA
jgi:hypothetical protein